MDAKSRHTRPVGALLRQLREQRQVSQFALAVQTEVSQRHLSFVETGRAKPSRDLLIRLADQLDLPLRECNRLLMAAGHAPTYSETTLDAEELGAVRNAIHSILYTHEPAPALVVDRHWNIIDRNRGVRVLSEGVASRLLEPPANVIRISLHPEGLAPKIVNLGEWRHHLLSRLRRQIAVSLDSELPALYDEVSAYPCADTWSPERGHEASGLVVPLRLRDDDGDETLEFLSTMTVFGTALDITVAELAIESFFPANAHTAARLQAKFTTERAQRRGAATQRSSAN